MRKPGPRSSKRVRRPARAAGRSRVWHDQHVSDVEIPDDLLQLKVAFYTTERDLAELSSAEPADPGRWKATHDRLGDLAVAIHRHPALQALPPIDRLKLDQAASSAAREQLAAQDSDGG